MTKAQAHCRQVLRVQPVQECGELTPDAAVKVKRLLVRHDLDPKLLTDRARYMDEWSALS